MLKFGEWVVKHKLLILLLGLALIVPATFGYLNTRVNYDILSYLPSDLETMQGQDILKDEFGKGGFSMVMIDGMSDKDVVATKQKIEAVEIIGSDGNGVGCAGFGVIPCAEIRISFLADKAEGLT